MTKLHPDLLRACASYLAHVGVYGANAVDVLRDDAFDCRNHDPMTSDELTRAHIKAICDRGRVKVGGRARGAEAVARAILESSPGMLAWWCQELAPRAEEGKTT
jgi:hypothetical protein